MRITSFQQYQTDYNRSLNQPDEFWSGIAAHFTWRKKWHTVLSGDFHQVDFKWFDGAQLNITENCIDRHLKTHGNKTALIWEPNDPSGRTKTFSYSELHQAVCKTANALKSIGIKRGDTVCIYMPMIPELMFAMLACARIGAIHNVVFGGFSAQSISDRIHDAGCKYVLTADGGYRGDKKIYLKQIVDDALQTCPEVQKVLVVKQTNFDIDMKPGRDVWWSDVVSHQADSCPVEIMEAEDPLFILYTSGSTGKPKGVVHTTAGYMVWTSYTFLNVFQYNDGDVYWCTADAGWITGHSYMVYGPLLNGATVVMFEGVPSYPNWNRWWQVIDKHKVNIFYTAPTAIRSLEAQGTKHFEGTDLSSLRILGTVGEPINEEAWHWYDENVGKKKCPIVDTWWQTETGGIMISPLAGITKTIPSYATLPLPGVEPVIVDSNGNALVETFVEGNLCMKRSWPGQARTVFNDHERFKLTYFSTYQGLYFTGDGCRRDNNGNYRITGRVDDVINVSGHRIGTAEVEDALDEHPNIVESAVVGYPHAIKGQALFAFVLCNETPDSEEKLKAEINDIVIKMIGAFAKPDKVLVVSGLPRTRSGKIMRRILRKIAEGEPDKVGDITTLLNPEVVEEIKQKATLVI